MYTGLIHTHKTFVYVFLAFYVIKLIALLINNEGMLAFFAKKAIRIVFDMVVPTIYLVTGIVMLMQKPADQIGSLLVIKIAIVLLSIPIAVVGFRKKNKLLATVAMLLLFGAYGIMEVYKRRPAVKPVEANADATAIYQANCISCHGADGKLMAAGAKDLSTSVLGDAEIKNRIQKGGNGMAGYEKVLTEQQIDQLVQHVKTLRK